MRKGVSWRNRVHQALLVAVTLLVTHSAFAEPLLYDIRYNPLLEGETELQLVFDEEITQQPNIQVFNSPARIEMRFTDTSVEKELEEVVINQAGIEKVSSQAKDGMLTVTVHMDSLKIYQTKVKNNLVSLHVSDNMLILLNN